MLQTARRAITGSPNRRNANRIGKRQDSGFYYADRLRELFAQDRSLERAGTVTRRAVER